MEFLNDGVFDPQPININRIYVYSHRLILIDRGRHQLTILNTGFLMDMSLSEWRKLLETAGKSIPVQNSRMTTAELLAHCATSNPFALCKFPCFYVSHSHGNPCLVPTGGVVFAGFITLFGSQRLLSKFNKLCRQPSLTHSLQMDH